MSKWIAKQTWTCASPDITHNISHYRLWCYYWNVIGIYLDATVNRKYANWENLHCGIKSRNMKALVETKPSSFQNLFIAGESAVVGNWELCLEYRVLPGFEPGTSAWPGRGPPEHRTRCVLSENNLRTRNRLILCLTIDMSCLTVMFLLAFMTRNIMSSCTLYEDDMMTTVSSLET